MKLDRYRKYVRTGVTAFLVLAASMIFYYLLFHQTSVRTAFHNVLDILSPLIAALILAYVISPIINFIEQRIIARLFARHGKTQSVRCKKLVRALLILLTYVAMLFALYGLIATLIPELFSSITNIVSNFSNYANNIQDFATKVLANYPEMQQTADQYISTFSACLKLLISPKRSDPPTSKPTFLRSSMMAVVRPVSMHRWPNSQPGRPPPMMATLRLMGHGDFSVIVRANDGV